MDIETIYDKHISTLPPEKQIEIAKLFSRHSSWVMSDLSGEITDSPCDLRRKIMRHLGLDPDVIPFWLILTLPTRFHSVVPSEMALLIRNKTRGSRFNWN